MPNDLSPTRQLADLKLEGGLDDFVNSRRQAGKSWRRISIDLRDITGIDITFETLRSWYPQDRRQGDWS